MAAFQFSLSSLPLSHLLQNPRFFAQNPRIQALQKSSPYLNHSQEANAVNPQKSRKSVRGAAINGAPEAQQPVRKSRKKATTTKTKEPKDSEFENGVVEVKNTEDEGLIPVEDVDDDEDEIDFSYDDPPLVCCFGAAQKEFVPTIRVSDAQMHPDIYSTWKNLQWTPPEFVRAPGGPPSNVAISHVRLGGRAAFMGKVGNDELGEELVYTMNKEKVQTRGVKFDSDAKTGATRLRIMFEDGRMKAEIVRPAAEDSMLSSELNVAVLKEARMFHFNSEVLTTPSMHSTLYRAIALSKKYGGLVFFDLNLPLPLWRSRDATRELIKKAWDQADIIEVTVQELEFLLDDKYYTWRRNYKHQYYAESFEKTKGRRDYYHYTREEISPLWHDGIKFLFVTDGTLRIHYYTPSFDGVVVGTEDVLIAPFTCDRTGSGDALVAAIMRKLTSQPEIYENQDELERQLRFVIAAGIISQWTIGAVRGFPTEGAALNLKKQVYVPSMW